MVGKIIRSLAWCAVAMAVVSTGRGIAAPFTWNAGTTGEWADSVNWLPTTNWPGSTNNVDTATFLSGSPTTVTVTGTVAGGTPVYLNALSVNRDLTITSSTTPTFSTGTYSQASNTAVTIDLTRPSAVFRLGGSVGTLNTFGAAASMTVNVTATTTASTGVSLGAGSLLTLNGPVNFNGNTVFGSSGTVAYAAASGTSNGFRFFLNDTAGLAVKSTAAAAIGATQPPIIATSGSNTITLERNLDLMTPVTTGTAGSLVIGWSRQLAAPTNSVQGSAEVTVSGPSTLSLNLLGVINSSTTALQRLVVDNGATVQVGDFSAGKAQGVSIVASGTTGFFQNATQSGTFQLDSASGGTLRVNANSSFNAPTAASGSSSLGLRLAVAGSSTLVNNGTWTNRNFTNTTILQGLSVAQAATLSGTGSFLMTSGNNGTAIGKSVALDGTVAPGDVVGGVNGVGTLTISSGTVTFGAASKVAISGSGATLDRLVLNAPVSVTSGAAIDFAAASNLTQGRYQVVIGSSGVNTFTASNAPAAYTFGTSGTDAYLWAKPVFGTITATPAAAQVITGGTAGFTYTVANASPSGGQTLNFTSSSGSGIVGTMSGTTTVAPGATSGSLSGFSYVGGTPGVAQAGTFTVSDPNAFATSATGTVALDVLAHATPGFATAAGAGVLDPFATGTIALDFGSLDVSAGRQILTYSLTNLASQVYGSSLTAGLALTNYTTDGSGFESGLSTFASLAASGTSSLFTAAFTPTAEGSFSKSYTLTFYDDQSVAGSTQQRNLTVNMQAVVVPEPGALAIAGVGVILASWQITRRRLRGRSCSTRP